MKARRDAPRSLPDVRRLELRLARLFGAIWLGLCVGLGLMTSFVYTRGAERDLDQDLRLSAMAAYGLAYYDTQGKFHDELLRAERSNLPPQHDLWIASPGRSPEVALAPAHPRCELDATLRTQAAEVLRGEVQDFRTLRDAEGRECRVRRLVTYSDGGAPIAAIFVATPTDSTKAIVRQFLVRLWGGLALVCGLGVLLATHAARRAALPLVHMMTEREHYLRAAAHELKTPLARMRIVTESAVSPVAPTAAESLMAIVDEADHAAHSFLRLAELSTRPVRERVAFRLDLTAELVIDDDVPFEVTPVVMVGDPDWIRIAIENLVHNARTHGHGVTLVRVDERGVCVQDSGPGFTEAALSMPVAPFRRGEHSRGTGLGLVLAEQIAESHGGRLVRRRRAEGGAEVSLELPARRVVDDERSRRGGPR